MKTLILTQNDCYRRGAKITPKGIMIHSTGANNPNLCRYVGPDDGNLGVNRYGNHWNQSGLDVCVHGFIGKADDGHIDGYQTLPYNYRAWHCGGSGNDTHLSFEICEDGLTNADYFRCTRDYAINLCADLCIQFGFDPMENGVLIDHSEGARMGIASNHGDISHWWNRFGYSMDNFRRDVAEKIKKSEWKEEMEKNEVQKIVNDSMKEFMSARGTKDEHSGWSDDAVKWAVDTGLVKGKENGDFGWKKPLTLERFITILHRFSKMTE